MFSWSNSNRNAYPGQRASTTSSFSGTGSVGFTRQQHIDSYIQDDALKRSTRRVSQDDSRHDTVFQTVNGDTLVLRVTLPLDSTTPSMKLVGVEARHSWLDSSMCVTTFGLTERDASQRWRETNLLLGKAVHQVIQHLQLYPPEITAIIDPALEKLQKPDSTLRGSSGQFRRASSSASTPPEVETTQPDIHVDIPRIPMRFSEIDELSKEEIRRILDDEDEFEAFINKLDISKQLVVDHSENVAIAKTNLSNQEKLRQLHTQAVSLQKELSESIAEYEKQRREYDNIVAKPDRREVIAELNKMKKRAFSASERIADHWLDSKGDVDEFLSEFLERRKIHHIYAAKADLI